MERSGHWLPRAWLNNHIKVVPQLRFRDSALCQFPAVASTPDAARYSLSLSLSRSLSCTILFRSERYHDTPVDDPSNTFSDAKRTLITYRSMFKNQSSYSASDYLVIYLL